MSDDEFSPGAAWESLASGQLAYVESSPHHNTDWVLLRYGTIGKSRYITRRGLRRKYTPAGRAEP